MPSLDRRARKKSNDNRFSDIDGGKAFSLPLTLMRHPNRERLSPAACKMILDLGTQYTGYNNGYLAAAKSILAPKGWRSEASIREAIAELEHFRIIVKTRQGGRNRCNLYAFTFRRIDEKPAKDLDVRSSIAPSNAWKSDGIGPYTRPSRKRKQVGIPRNGWNQPPQRTESNH